MAFFKPTVFALCVLLCICSVPTTVSAKSIKLKYSVHEVRQGPNATIITAAGTPGVFAWGTLLMNDNEVRETESTTSKLLGKSTGFGGITTKAGIGGGILSVTKVIFNGNSKYNTSTLTLTISLATPSPPYEGIVLGGTGKFRGCRGYALSSPGLASPPVFTSNVVISLKC